MSQSSFTKYDKMQKMGLPENFIRNKMLMEGITEDKINEYFGSKREKVPKRKMIVIDGEHKQDEKEEKVDFSATKCVESPPSLCYNDICKPSVTHLSSNIKVNTKYLSYSTNISKNETRLIIQDLNNFGKNSDKYFYYLSKESNVVLDTDFNPFVPNVISGVMENGTIKSFKIGGDNDNDNDKDKDSNNVIMMDSVEVLDTAGSRKKKIDAALIGYHPCVPNIISTTGLGSNQIKIFDIEKGKSLSTYVSSIVARTNIFSILKMRVDDGGSIFINNSRPESIDNGHYSMKWSPNGGLIAIGTNSSIEMFDPRKSMKSYTPKKNQTPDSVVFINVPFPKRDIMLSCFNFYHGVCTQKKKKTIKQNKK